MVMEGIVAMAYSGSESRRRVIALGIAFFFIFNGAAVVGQETVYNVMNYGAKCDGQTDDATALIQAWRAGCDSTGLSRILIPAGKQLTMGEVVLQGPCKAPPPIVIDIQGQINAIPDPSAYSNGVWILIDKVDGVEVTGGGTLNGNGKTLWQYADKENHLAVTIILQKVTNSKMHNLHLIDSMGYHSKVSDSKDVIVSNMTITAPEESPNTDGLHMSNATNVQVTDSIIGTGDDCISVGDGTTNILVTRIQCGPGHGLSVGSLGKRVGETSVNGVTIVNCTLNGTTNGARIKTHHQSPAITANNIVFKDLIMVKVKNPIIIDQHYESKAKPEQSSVKISNTKFVNIKGTTISEIPIRLNCSSKVPCENIELNNIDLTPFDTAETPTLSSACFSAKFVVSGTVNPPAPSGCV